MAFPSPAGTQWPRGESWNGWNKLAALPFAMFCTSGTHCATGEFLCILPISGHLGALNKQQELPACTQGHTGRAPCWPLMTLKIPPWHLLKFFLFSGRSAAFLPTAVRALPPQHTEMRYPDHTLAFFLSSCLPGIAARWALEAGFWEQSSGQ